MRDSLDSDPTQGPRTGTQAEQSMDERLARGSWGAGTVGVKCVVAYLPLPPASKTPQPFFLQNLSGQSHSNDFYLFRPPECTRSPYAVCCAALACAPPCPTCLRRHAIFLNLDGTSSGSSCSETSVAVHILHPKPNDRIPPTKTLHEELCSVAAPSWFCPLLMHTRPLPFKAFLGTQLSVSCITVFQVKCNAILPTTDQYFKDPRKYSILWAKCADTQKKIQKINSFFRARPWVW